MWFQLKSNFESQFYHDFSVQPHKLSSVSIAQIRFESGFEPGLKQLSPYCAVELQDNFYHFDFSAVGTDKDHTLFMLIKVSP